MIISAHLISGGVIGEAVGSPFTAFFAGLLFHFVLDAIPHYDNVLENDRWTKKQVIFTSLDLILALVLFIALKPDISISNPFCWGAFGGLFPDLIDNVPVIRDHLLQNKIIQKYHIFHEATHIIRKPGIFFGLLTQVAVIAIFVVLHFVLK